MDQAKKAQLQKLVFAGLLAVLGLGIFNSFKFLMPSPGVRMTAATAPVTRQLEAFQKIEAMSDKNGHGALLADANRVPIRYTAADYRDPLVSLVPQPKPESLMEHAEVAPPKPAPVAPNVKIEGMLWGGSRPQVLIEGKLYEIGDTVQDSEIVGISRDGVTVVNQGTTFVLRPPRTADAAAPRPMMEHGR